MTTIRQEIKEYLDHFYIEQSMIGYSLECMDYDIIKIITNRIDSLYPSNPIDTQYKTGYYNAICEVMELLK
jgi:hypothetical protein